MPFLLPKPVRQPKKRHKGITAKERAAKCRDDETVYLRNRVIALVRERYCCQFCGRVAGQTHHVGARKRSKTRGMHPDYRHHPDWLMVLCGIGGQDGCHGLVESGTVKVEGDAINYMCTRKNTSTGIYELWVPLSNTA